MSPEKINIRHIIAHEKMLDIICHYEKLNLKNVYI